MFILNFSGYNHQRHGRYSLGHIRLEHCLDYLTALLRQGWQLDWIQLVDGSSAIELPVEAFDGEFMSQPFKELQDQWEQVLA